MIAGKGCQRIDDRQLVFRAQEAARLDGLAAVAGQDRCHARGRANLVGDLVNGLVGGLVFGLALDLLAAGTEVVAAEALTGFGQARPDVVLLANRNRGLVFGLVFGLFFRLVGALVGGSALRWPAAGQRRGDGRSSSTPTQRDTSLAPPR
jgi:hypothetical protein